MSGTKWITLWTIFRVLLFILNILECVQEGYGSKLVIKKIILEHKIIKIENINMTLIQLDRSSGYWKNGCI